MLLACCSFYLDIALQARKEREQCSAVGAELLSVRSQLAEAERGQAMAQEQVGGASCRLESGVTLPHLAPGAPIAGCSTLSAI